MRIAFVHLQILAAYFEKAEVAILAPNFIHTEMKNPAGILKPVAAAGAVASDSGVVAVLLHGIFRRRRILLGDGLRRHSSVASDLVECGAGSHCRESRSAGVVAAKTGEREREREREREGQ